MWGAGLGACDSWQVEPIGRVVMTNFPAMRAAQVHKPTRQSRSMSDNNENKPAPTLGPDIMAAIGRELRLLYADIIAAGVPERFVEILRWMIRATRGRRDDPHAPQAARARPHRWARTVTRLESTGSGGD
jgi:hypothetical protein